MGSYFWTSSRFLLIWRKSQSTLVSHYNLQSTTRLKPKAHFLLSIFLCAAHRYYAQRLRRSRWWIGTSTIHARIFHISSKMGATGSNADSKNTRRKRLYFLQNEQTAKLVVNYQLFQCVHSFRYALNTAQSLVDFIFDALKKLLDYSESPERQVTAVQRYAVVDSQENNSLVPEMSRNYSSLQNFVANICLPFTILLK